MDPSSLTTRARGAAISDHNYNLELYGGSCCYPTQHVRTHVWGTSIFGALRIQDAISLILPLRNHQHRNYRQRHWHSESPLSLRYETNPYTVLLPDPTLTPPVFTPTLFYCYN